MNLRTLHQNIISLLTPVERVELNLCRTGKPAEAAVASLSVFLAPWWPMERKTADQKTISSGGPSSQLVNPLAYNPYTAPEWRAMMAALEARLEPAELAAANRLRSRLVSCAAGLGKATYETWPGQDRTKDSVFKTGPSASGTQFRRS
ncbi:unnamed protein product [Protopolystoma xenopodis]|uniref:Uncharacterized protein n=1 Tax=Protopolystoma xenopodis TaxID=117903 RepID=A0A3S5FCW7_9PLAT|nr:unnamed protein product [Protopolystoma xenopodis]